MYREGASTFGTMGKRSTGGSSRLAQTINTYPLYIHVIVSLSLSLSGRSISEKGRIRGVEEWKGRDLGS